MFRFWGGGLHSVCKAESSNVEVRRSYLCDGDVGSLNLLSFLMKVLCTAERDIY